MQGKVLLFVPSALDLGLCPHTCAPSVQGAKGIRYQCLSLCKLQGYQRFTIPYADLCALLCEISHSSKWEISPGKAPSKCTVDLTEKETLVEEACYTIKRNSNLEALLHTVQKVFACSFFPPLSPHTLPPLLCTFLFLECVCYSFGSITIPECP